ncbi:MAG TPA: LamG domain-containing protein [Nannocystaceae bacterium]|nr:LamG domain-containing protein [Nannocystaceae bacterium]
MRARSSVLALSIALGCGRDVFACKQTADCGPNGACEPDGWCSFPDDACDSGRRYGHWVGDGLADHCVPSGVADTGGTTTSTSTTTTNAVTTASMDSTGMMTTIASSDDGPASTSADPTTGEASTGEPGSDLVAWYQFEADVFDGVVLDSANGHDGVCEGEGCPLSMPGVVGNAAFFDGVDDIVIVADHPDFATASGFTLAAWVMLDAEPVGFRCVVAKPLDDVTNLDAYELGREAEGHATANMTFADGGRAELAAPELLQAGEWTHLAATWDGITMRLFVAGAETMAADAPSLQLTAHDLNFGASWDQGMPSDFLLGGIDELQIWRRALTGEEIAELANP